MLIVDLLVPATMIGFGRLFLMKPPQNINAAYGYRTTMSMKNKDTWNFAHKHCGKVWFKCGIVLLPLSVVLLLPAFNKDIETVGIAGAIVIAVQLVLLIGSFFLTEAALKKAFDRNGIRK